MVKSERRWLLSIIMSVVLAVTMLSTPLSAFADEGGGDGSGEYTGTDPEYTFTNSDGQQVSAYESNDGFIYGVVNSDGQNVAKVYGDKNAKGKTNIDIPNELGGVPVVSEAIDPRYPVAGESYDSVAKVSLPENLQYYHYLKFFDTLEAIDVAAGNTKYKGETDGVLYRANKDGKTYRVSLYPHGKKDTKWVMPDYVDRGCTFYEGCPLEEITIPGDIDLSVRKMFKSDQLSNLKAVYTTDAKYVDTKTYSDGSTRSRTEYYYSKDGVLYSYYNYVKKNKEGETTYESTDNYLEFYPFAKEDKNYTVKDDTESIEYNAINDVPALEKLTLATYTYKKSDGSEFTENTKVVEDNLEGCYGLKEIEFTAENAPDNDYFDYDDYYGIKQAVRQNSKINIIYPKDGIGYDEFVSWLKKIGFGRVSENPEVIKAGDEKTVNLKKDDVITYKFTPTETAPYYFESDGHADTIVFTDEKLISDSWDRDDQEDGSICYFIGKAGTTYYLQTTSYNNDIEDKVRLEKSTEAVPISVDFGTDKIVYTGKVQKPAPIVKDTNGDVIDSSKYRVKYRNNINAGTAKVTINFKEWDYIPYYYYEDLAGSFTIAKADQNIKADSQIKVRKNKSADIALTGAVGTVKYTTANKKIAKVSSAGKVAGVKVGTTTITATVAGNSNYNAATVKIKVIVPTVITKATLKKTSLVYNGKAQRPSIKKVNNSTKLKEGKAYEVTYPENAVEVGTYKITIKGIGNYDGSVTKTYKITKAKQKITVAAPKIKKGETAQLEPKVTGAGADPTGKITYKSANKKIATVDANGVITAKKAGKVKITITAAADGHYTKATKTIKVKVTK